MKKNIHVIIIFICIFYIPNLLYGQEPLSPCENIINQLCTVNLSNPIPGLKTDSVNGTDYIIYGKVPAPAEYKDVLYGKDPNRNCDNLDPDSTYCLDNTEQLRFSAFFPDSISGSKITCPLPTILMFHPGSFLECPNYQQQRMEVICRELAKRGFIVFSFEYRRGVLIDNRFDPTGIFTYVSAQQILGVYRACQDIRGAIRSVIHMQRNKNQFNYFGGEFNIDTNNLFLGGMSAGSIMAMNAAYYQRQGQMDSSYPGAGSVLGDLDAPFYVGDTTINYIPKIKGVLSMWGGMAIHKTMGNNPESFFNGLGYIPPLIAFHGRNDNIFPYDSASIYHSPDSSRSKKVNFNIVRNCLVNGSIYQVDINKDSIDAIAIGPDSLWRIFKNRQIPVEVYLDCEMEHGLDECDTCTTNSFFMSDFGTGYDTADEVYAYIAGRTATFFVAVLNGIAINLGRSRFVECENKRKKCDTADNSTCGYPIGDEDNAFNTLCN